jgi:NADP-dependent 3-hydroxy acid dehydrogenase YdfG
VQTAVVTGASRGIGRAIATAFVQAGIRTFMLARGADELHRAAVYLGELARPVVCDISNADSIVDVAERIATETHGAPDVLVNNAGLFPLALLQDMHTEDFERTLQVNVVAPFRFVRAFLPAMLHRRYGHVITIGSVADRTVYPENGAYAASKHAQRAMHEVLRQELQGSGVRASLVSPGPTDTSIWDTIDPDNREGFPSRANMLTATAVANAVLWTVSCPSDVNIDELRLSRA